VVKLKGGIKRMALDHDRLFKELLTTFFKEFMEAFFPEAYEYLDYSYLEFLPQEIITDVTAGEKNEVDILVKTKLLGEEGFILIHVEPQAYSERDFNRRMFKYFARLHEKYYHRVLPIAVLAHGARKEKPNNYQVTFPFWHVLNFKFMQLHLKGLPWKDYLKFDNPAAAALLSHMDYKKEERRKLKKEFFRMLIRMELDPAKMQLLAGFFDSYLELPPEEELEVEKELKKELSLEEVEVMTEILTSWHKRGRQEGKLEALRKVVTTLARSKFGELTPSTEEKINQEEDVEKLEEIACKMINLSSEEELLELLVVS